jgi:hypothetical protein
LRLFIIIYRWVSQYSPQAQLLAHLLRQPVVPVGEDVHPLFPVC